MPVPSLTAAAALTLLIAAMPAKPPEARRETKLPFAVHSGLQERGGVQYFFTVLHPEDSPLDQEPLRGLAKLLPPNPEGWEGLHAMASRFVYTLEKDVSFFTAERANDLGYIRALMPEADVKRLGEWRFRSELLPASNFRVRFLGPDELAGLQNSGPLKAFLGLSPGVGAPTSVAIQENDEFARVMGVRTAAISITWTGYHRLGPGRTRVDSYGLTLLHNVPPFFLGGDKRLHDSLLKETLTLIAAMRNFKAPPPVLPVIVPVPPLSPIPLVVPAAQPADGSDAGSPANPVRSGSAPGALDAGTQVRSGSVSGAPDAGVLTPAGG